MINNIQLARQINPEKDWLVTDKMFIIDGRLAKVINTSPGHIDNVPIVSEIEFMSSGERVYPSVWAHNYRSTFSDPLNSHITIL